MASPSHVTITARQQADYEFIFRQSMFLDQQYGERGNAQFDWSELRDLEARMGPHQQIFRSRGVAAAFLTYLCMERRMKELETSISSKADSVKTTLEEFQQGTSFELISRINDIVKAQLQEAGYTKERAEAEKKEQEAAAAINTKLTELAQKLIGLTDQDEKKKVVGEALGQLHLEVSKLDGSYDERTQTITTLAAILSEVTGGTPQAPVKTNAPKEANIAAGDQINTQKEKDVTRNWLAKDSQNSSWTQASFRQNQLLVGDQSTWTKFGVVGDGSCAFHALLGTFSNQVYRATADTRMTVVSMLKANHHFPVVSPLFRARLQDLLSAYLHNQKEHSEAWIVFSNHQLINELKRDLSALNEACLECLSRHTDICRELKIDPEKLVEKASRNVCHELFIQFNERLRSVDAALCTKAQIIRQRLDNAKVDSDSRTHELYFTALTRSDYYLNTDELKIVAELFGLKYYLFSRQSGNQYVCLDSHNTQLTDQEPIVLIHEGYNHYSRLHILNDQK